MWPIGTTFRLRFGSQEEVWTVGTKPNVTNGVISHRSPLGRFLLQIARIGVLDFKQPDGTRVEYQVLEIAPPPGSSSTAQRDITPGNYNKRKRRGAGLSRLTSIRRIVETRGVKSLVHFTRLENLSSIVKYGLVPRADIQQISSLGVPVHFNDQYRWDGLLTASSLSVSFPNYQTFFRFRNDHASSKWSVVLFDPRVLWVKECAFCHTNAADSQIQQLPLSYRQSPEAFESLFTESYTQKNGYTVSRSDLDIPGFYTTNPQAEVLIFGTIEPDYIQALCFDSQVDMKEWAQSHPSLSQLCRFVPEYFGPRSDYHHWRKHI